MKKYPNKSKKYSYSRLSSFEGCKLQYYYKYIMGFSTNKETNEYAAKGLSIHEILEWMDSSKTYEELYQFALTRIKDNNVDIEKYPVLNALPRIYAWWKEYITTYENNGWVLKKESWQELTFMNNNLVGALDSILYNSKTNQYRITDFKTPKNAVVSGYKNQLILYAWMIGIKNNININDLANKIELFVFFPLAKLDDTELTDETICRKNMLKNYIQVKYTTKDISDLIKKYEDEIKAEQEYDWEQINKNSGELSFTCNFCDFCGMPENKELGFYGCQNSRDKGLIARRSTKIITKS